MQALIQNLRYALRQLRQSPGFTLTVVLTLALGVGANAVVFSVLNAIILRPLPLPDARQLVFFNRIGDTGNVSSSPANSYPDYRDLRDQNRTFSGIAIYRFERAGVGVAGAVRQSWDIEASENYFDVLGVKPYLGRLFHTSDGHGPNSMPYVVLSYAYWRSHFNGDRSIVGKSIELNKRPFTVLGVAEPSFKGTELFFAPDLWAPIIDQEQLDGVNDMESRGDHNSWVIGRLKPGVSWGEADADLNTIARRLAEQYKSTNEKLGFRVAQPGLLGDFLGGPVKAFLGGVMALAVLVLIAACANLGSLFAARAADRAKEFALRLALGAGRETLVRQLLTESILISLVGGVAGLLAATGVLRALTLWRPSPDFPVQVAVNADARVGVTALLLALASGIFFGLVPVQQVWRGNAYAVMKSGTGSGEAAGSKRWTLRDLLLVVQIVLCSVLVTSALVAVRGLSRTLHSSYGFQPEGVLLASFDLRMVGKNEQQSLRFQHEAADRVAALPGVMAVGFSNTTPLSLSSSDTDIYRDGTTDFRASTAATDASYFDISPGYFAAAGTRLLSGRDLTWHDDAQAPRVIVVNQTLVREVFGLKAGLEQQALGRYVVTGSKRRWQIVGIVEDGKYQSLTEAQAAAMFFPTAQEPDTMTVLVIRSQNAQATTAASVDKVLREMEPSLPLLITGWPQSLGMVLFPSIAATASLGVMGGLAAMLAVTGIFGMASYSVSQRLRELGLRVALGAGRQQVLSAALGRPARLLVIGSAVGLGLGATASRLLAHIVYQATPQDPVVLVGVVASMALLALAATWLPARRALRVDPARLLREE
jgi:predicted permease